jgi:hypothetical protein
MRYETVTHRIGENVGPVDWDHPLATRMPPIWRSAAGTPDAFLYNGRSIVEICMYDGWPYWTPTPAIHYIGPLNSGEWDFFNSYGCHPTSITRRVR